MVCRNLVQLRNYCTKKSVFYVTTPIYYVNAAPHIGHLHSSIIADVVHRYQRILNPQSLSKFATGTDEHGQKIQKSAQAKNIQVENFCSDISTEYKYMSDRFSIDYTDFIRTTDERHKRTVQEFWKTIDRKGHIYSSQYVGWYCVNDESFLTETQTKEIDLPSGKIRVSIESGNPVEWTDEKNYMFRLSNVQDDLIYWLTRNENVVKPKKFYKILLDMITKDKLPDWSISRPSSRIHWGIKVPGDDTQTVHVWLDALINYLTVAGYSNPVNSNFQKVWPPDVQVIGKDILKFHGIYWPAFLLATNLEPPKLLLCHSHWTVDGQKMSKSKNNVICPIKSSYTYTSEGLRYFLLHEDVTHSDGNYNDKKIADIIDTELYNRFCNLLRRCTSETLNPNQVFPSIDLEAFQVIESKNVTEKLIDSVITLPDECCEHYDQFNFHRVINSVITTLRNADLFFETLKPWEFKKEKNFKELDAVLHITLETLRIASVILLPIVPNISQDILNKMRVPEGERTWSSLKHLSWKRSSFIERELSQESIVFKRINVKNLKA